MELLLTEDSTRENAFETVRGYLDGLSLGIAAVDDQRPWGGFYVIAKESERDFIEQFFPEVNRDDIYKYGDELGPKILLVEPHQKLSWQYHNRRAELWKAILGPVGVMVSETDEQPEQPDILNTGEVVQHDNQVRHRLLGLGTWGVVAEIWQHTDPENPTDEDDIVRLEDSYGRS